MLKEQNQHILVLDKGGIASGGSGAAGAFVSPKIGKGSVLQKLTNEAFAYAKDFYLDVCPMYFNQTGVVRVPKDKQDAMAFSTYEKYNENNYKVYSKETLHSLGIDSDFDSFYFPEAGSCDALGVCEYLLKDVEVLKYEVTHLSQQNGIWKIGDYKAKNIILATGHEHDLADLRYMGIRGTWGNRGDFSTHLDLRVSMHQSMSVGANQEGIIKLGATHEKEIKKAIPCSHAQALSLKQRASGLINTSDLELKKVFCGMRAGSKDYVPLLGKVIDVPYMLKTYPALTRGAKPALTYRENLYVFNGLGGRGFVFAPLLAKWLSDYIINNKELKSNVCADRLFLKWCRKGMK